MQSLQPTVSETGHSPRIIARQPSKAPSKIAAHALDKAEGFCWALELAILYAEGADDRSQVTALNKLVKSARQRVETLRGQVQ